MDRQQVENETGEIYGNLFTSYSKKLFNESVDLFFKRQKMWGRLSFDWFKGKDCLDAGCGGGRFTVAMSMLGANVRSIDVSKRAVEAAKQRIAERGLQAEITHASVLDIPYGNEKFDYVLCSGVVMCTPNPWKGIEELDRVLRKGGTLFLSVYGKGGLKWALNDLLRYTICKIIPFNVMEKIWATVGVPANKRYNLLDNLYTPYMWKFREDEIRRWLKEKGYTNIERVKFERYDYSTIFSRIIHGEGWIQIYADKR